jgi:hypothetical protein
MRKQTLSVVVMGLLAASGAGGSGILRPLFNAPPTKTETTLPDGNISVQQQYYQLTRSGQATDPTNDTAGNCYANMIMTKAGTVLSGSGFCCEQDDKGNGSTFSWKVDEAGTAKCPLMCGSGSYVDGYGKFRGTTGGGSWVQTRAFADGAAIGTYTSNYKTP